MCRLLRISREDLIVNLDKSVFGFGHPDDIGRMAYFGKNFAAHTDEKYDVFSAGRHQRWRITIFSTPGPTMCWLMASAWASSFTATWKNPARTTRF
ncbi:hypothetical protein LOB54_07590 [Lactobacillus delbrueckii subsp. bulgaricus]|uniref:hypothetical protein n=1 Tax=Lactobacillus delbrueckii TaxID=1584 RepID=UPI001BFFD5CE|nr:hypothetical protein [Lactobacillus delbrueckii]MCD5462520.1 hypothetical protein [Lactobacillus delbrueckii subsp. bulgaricus]MCD5478095.1 hypothetical protein [Lactobacillus delbrueckii subsp. bulgaricus]MDA3801990.1 hypothetical protein [Lactobacillus delbrueckii]UUY36483.1 hypothetical protein NUU01_04395 [Lactobacillus delbrueckii subsp. bulgaricus]